MGVAEKSLVELAKVISDRASTLQKYLEEEKLPQPTILANGPQEDFLLHGSQEAKAVRNELRDAAMQLNALATGTSWRLLELAAGDMHNASSHRLLWKYGIPQHVPDEGSISYSDLAQKVGLDEDRLRRLVTFEQTNYVFTEPERDRVSHTAVSKLMASEFGSALLGHMMDDCYPAFASAVDAWEKWPRSNNPAHTGFQIANKTDKPFFAFCMEEAPWRVARFGKAMEFFTNVTMAEIFEFDWAALGPAKIVDVGGSNGQKAIAIARAAPKVTCVVQDLESAVNSAPAVPSDVASRVVFEVYDMFTPQKHTDADVFFFGRIFHDWPNHDCLRILEQLVPAMKPGARLVMNEFSKVPLSGKSLINQAFVSWVDMQMMLLLGARERPLQEWKNLVRQGSHGKLVLEKASAGIVSFIKASTA